MSKVNILLMCLIILAVTGFTMLFLSQRRLKQQDFIMKEKMAEYSEQQESMLQTNLDMQKNREETEKLTRQAREAQQMAEAQAEKERLERERLVAELNARLQKESEDRFKAEEAQRELAEKLQALQAAQAETQKALAALEEAKMELETTDDESRQDALELKEKIEQQSQQMAAIMEENRLLKERRENLVKKQMSTAEAIAEMGGTIERSKFVDVFLESIEDIVKGVSSLFDENKSKDQP